MEEGSEENDVARPVVVVNRSNDGPLDIQSHMSFRGGEHTPANNMKSSREAIQEIALGEYCRS